MWQGRAVRRVDKGFRRARGLAGLASDVVGHTLRHTCATWMAQRGVPPWEAAGFAGMSVEVFEAVYGHHSPDFQHNAANSFNKSGQKPDRNTENKRSRTWPEGTNIVDFSSIPRQP
jgi:integrase